MELDTFIEGFSGEIKKSLPERVSQDLTTIYTGLELSGLAKNLTPKQVEAIYNTYKIGVATGDILNVEIKNLTS